METLNVVDIATVGLAVATTILAAFTGWLAWETRQIRANEKRERVRVAFRAALIEQLDNCREWQTHPPDRGAPMLEYLHGRVPKFEAVERLLGTVDVAGDLAAYVVWLIAQIRDEHQRFDATLAPPISGEALLRADNSRDPWWVLVDRLQTLMALLQEEARRFGVQSVLPVDARWLRPLPGPPDARVLTDANDHALRGAPMWPSGFDICAPAKRDEQGAALAYEQQTQLAESLNPALTS